jgi:hypothetical protein
MQADVRSLQAMRDWVGAVRVYHDDAAAALASIEMEIRRATDWVAEQEGRWHAAAKQCEEELWTAKQDLNARKLPDWSGREPDTTVQERAVRRCEARLEHCQDQIQRCRQWTQRLPKMIDETYRGNAHRLAMFLDGDLARALALFGKQIASLEAYAGERPDFAPVPITT